LGRGSGSQEQFYYRLVPTPQGYLKRGVFGKVGRFQIRGARQFEFDIGGLTKRGGPD